MIKMQITLPKILCISLGIGTVLSQDMGGGLVGDADRPILSSFSLSLSFALSLFSYLLLYFFPLYLSIYLSMKRQ